MKIICHLAIIFLILVSVKSLGQDEQDKDASAFEPTLGYICDAGRNFSGGIEKGNAYNGLAYAGIALHTEKMWKGGEFAVEIMNSHGHGLSSHYIGDIQVASNIENGDYTFLYQLLYIQRFALGYAMLGILDLNAEFAASEYGAALTNSSFGIHSTFPLNFHVSIYPKNALAILGCYTIADGFSIRTGLYDANAGSLERDKYNTNWTIEELMSITEIEYSSRKSLNTIVKIGGHYLSGEYRSESDTLKSTKGNYGFYLVADQKLIDSHVRALGAFAQLGYAPVDRNFNIFYVGAGVNLFAPFSKRPDDIVSCGAAYAQLFDDTNECDLELNYNFNLNKYISIQPAFHYIINPGANQGLGDAFAGFLRINVEL